jgi:hypothetical protein
MTISQQESRRRIAFAVLAPFARVAVNWALSLREAKQLIELAYYAEARRRGYKLREVSELLSVSMSKLGLLSRDLKEIFDEGTEGQTTARRVLSVLGAGPLSEAKLLSVLDDEEAETVKAVLDEMVAQQLLEIVPGRTPLYRLASAQYRLVQEPWMARYDALNHLMTAVGQTIDARFERGDSAAMARTLSFKIRREDRARLTELYEKQIVPLVVELDQAAVAAGDAGVAMNVAIMWAPDNDGPNRPEMDNAKEST